MLIRNALPGATRNMTRFRLPLLLAALLLAAMPAVAGTVSMISEQRWVTVARVYDGDTFETRHGEKVRLLGINTPEIAHGDSPAEPWGNKATAALHRLIDGQQLLLKFDREKRDRYGRLLAQVWLRDGRWVNGQMVREGYAHVYTFTPNLRWSSKLLDEELPARRERIGIWDHKRFEILAAKDVSRRHIGEFRVVHGTVKAFDRKGWRFKLAGLNISVPRKYRQWYEDGLRLHSGQIVTVRGKIRISSAGRLFLALHAPTDLEVEKP